MTIASILSRGASNGRGVARAATQVAASCVRFVGAAVIGSPRDGRLAAAAAAGDTEVVERLLAEGGGDPNTQDRRGRTALHRAVVCGHPDTAAVLLARGADPHVADRRGRTALSLDHTTPEMLLAVRQRYHRLPARERPRVTSERARAWARELGQRGILRVSGLIPAEGLARMQADCAEFVRGLDAKLAAGGGVFRRWEEEEHWWPRERFYESNNPFKHSPSLVRLCCDEDLLQTANEYLGKPAFVQRAQAYRYPPTDQPQGAQFEWHHDVEEKRFKVMVLLTEVGEGDQYMTYVVGSHKLFHPYAMFRVNPCSLDYCHERLGELEIFRATGRAGDVILFDSNGAHRGNRSPTARGRDVFIVAYSADKTYTWGADIDSRVLEGMRWRDQNPLERVLLAPKVWDLPPGQRASTWLSSLTRLNDWL